MRDSIRPGSSPVRILLDYRPALRHRTGVGEYVHELARALVESDHVGAGDLTLFSASWKDRLDPAVIPGASVVDRRIPVGALNFAWHRLGWPPVEQVAGQDFDVVQSFHPLLIPARRSAQLVTIHDLDFLDHPERTRAEIRRDYPRLAARHARRADHVIVNSRHTSADVQRRLGVSPERITVCYPGAPAWQARTAEPPDGYILFLGALEPRKNLGVLLDAYERLIHQMPTIPPLVLAGKASVESKLILARVADRPLAGRVQLPGYISASDREALFNRALLFVMPSHTEGFGMPVVEAMKCGVPVIAADRGALPEVAGRAADYFEPDDVDGLTALLHSVLTEPARRAVMRARGLEEAARFDWAASAGALQDAWARSIATRRSGRV